MSNDVTFVRIQSDQITGRGQFNHRPFDLFANEIEKGIDLSMKKRHVNVDSDNEENRPGTAIFFLRHHAITI